MAKGYLLFHLHDADAQLVFPDAVGGLEHLDADLPGLDCIRLADPHHAILGALVVALQPDILADFSNAGDRHQARSDHGNLVSAAKLRIRTAGVQEKLYGHSNMQTFFAPWVNRDSSRTGRSRGAAFVRLHN